MIGMATRDILPACAAYARALAETVSGVKAVALKAPLGALEKTIADLCEGMEALAKNTATLEKVLGDAHREPDIVAHAKASREKVFAAMGLVREAGDRLERITAKTYWPFPTYEDFLFRL